MLEGARVVAGALDRDAPMQAVYVDAGTTRPDDDALIARLRDAGVPVREVARGVLARVASTVTPQPVVAVATWRDVSPRDAFAEFAGDGAVVVAVDVADPGNAGTIMRSAEAAGVAGLVFCGNSVDPHNPKVVRASAGAIFGIPVVEGEDPVHVLDALGAQRRRSVAAVARAGTPYDRCDLRGPVVLVVGGEARGLSDAVVERADERVTIPMAGRAESLNVGVACSVLAFEAARQRRAHAEDAP